MAEDGEFGVFTSNKFAFLDDDEDEPVKAKKAEPKPEEKKADAKKTDKRAPRQDKPQREGGDRGDRRPREGGKGGKGGKGGDRRPPREGGKGGDRGDRPPREPREQGDRPPREPREGGEGGKGGRGGGGGRGGRGGRGGGNKREFDRHVPGTGRRDSQRKGGAGAHNWGVEGEEAKKETPEEATDVEEKIQAETTEDAGKENATPENVEPEPEPEPDQMTLEEYKESLKEKRPEEDNKIARGVANDGFEGQAAADFVKADSDDEGPTYVLGGATKKKGKKRNPNKKALMNIDEFMKDGEQQQRGYKGRGQGARRPGRGGGRLNMDDFPKLG